MKKIREIFGENVHSLRKERGWTQRELAEKAGIASNSLSILEAGERYPEEKTGEHLAAALCVDPERLYVHPDTVPEPTPIACVLGLAKHFGLRIMPPRRRRKKSTPS